MRKSGKELWFWCGYFLYVFKVWMHGVFVNRPPKGMKMAKHLITYGIDDADGNHIEYHEGTFWEFVKWIVTHESLDNL